MSYKQRFIQARIASAARSFPIVLLVGARQVGKSTTLQNLFPDLPVVTFHPTKDTQGARSNPELFLNQFTTPVILDEIQFAPELLAYLKIRVDQKPGEKGLYFLTGSQNLSVLKSVAESMAGRVAIIEMNPMAPTERYAQNTALYRHWLEYYFQFPETLLSRVVGLEQTPPVTQCIWRGGYPGLLTVDDGMLRSYFEGYLQTYIDRDVRSVAEFDRIVQFEDFVSILAALSAQEINYNQLGREIDVAGKTAQRWLDVLQSTYMWRDVRPYVGNAVKRVSNRRKGYFVDTGFACQLHRISSPQGVLGHPLCGALFETFVNNIIYAVTQALPFGVTQYHWRTSGGAEVDIIFELDGKLFPIEVKMKSNPNAYDARGIRSFQETYKNSSYRVVPGVIVHAGTEAYALTENIIALPWNALCA